MTQRVATDGTIFDRVGEFVFGQGGRINVLFFNDKPGYADAVFKFVQALASSKKLLGGTRVPLTDESAKLKDELIEMDGLEYSDFFAEEHRTIFKASALRWLEENWPKIIEELSNSSSTASIAILGQLRREFYYRWVIQHPNWNPHRYVFKEDSIRLPPLILHRLVDDLKILCGGFRIAANEEELKVWADQTVVSHYRIFGEYLLHLDEEYLPALTRTSLGFLEAPQGEVERVVMPFVGLAALKKVKDRQNLVREVMEWREGEGRKVVDGIDHFQQVLRTIPDKNARRKELAQIGELLQSELGMPFRILFPFLRIGRQDFSGADEAAQMVRKTLAYRWIWQIRNPRLHQEWLSRLDELLP